MQSTNRSYRYIADRRHLAGRTRGAKMTQSFEPIQGAAQADELQDWVKPEIISFKPVEAAEGISYRPSDGIANLTP